MGGGKLVKRVKDGFERSPESWDDRDDSGQGRRRVDRR